jgi:hypothetical protein
MARRHEPGGGIQTPFAYATVFGVNSSMSSHPPDLPHDSPDESPDEVPDDGQDEQPDGTDDAPPPEPRGPFTRENPLTFIVPEPLLLRIERVDRPGAAPGEQPVAFTRAGPGEVLLAVNAYPSQLVDAFFASDAFGEPVIVVGAAWEEEGGVRGELSTLLPERTMRAIQESVSPEDDDDEDEREPWAASAHTGGTPYEEVVGSNDDDEDEDEDEDDDDDDEGEEGDEDEDDEDAEPHFPLVIGAVLRFPENRKFPRDFELEVDDLMRAILEGRAMDAGEKRIDNMLGDL